jgi:hypothetical protein
MPPPVSSVEICNLALDAFGERGGVTSIETPVSTTEVIMARHYDVTRRALLREEIWNFARAEATLSRTGDGGLYYKDEFTVPNDLIRLLSIGSPGCKIECYDYTGELIKINAKPFHLFDVVTPTNSLMVRYTKDITDASKFDALFVKYLSIQLAIDVSYKFSQDRLQQQELVSQLKLELPKIVSVNSQERKPRLIRRSRWADARTYSQGGFDIEETSDHMYWVVL